MREDQYNYYPSADPLNDFSPDLQAETFSQSRSLNNVGLRADVSHVKGIHNIKVGATPRTLDFLTESDNLGIVDPKLPGSPAWVARTPRFPPASILLPST